MNPTRWIALHCGEEAETLLARHPNAFLLLCQIAMRARWKSCPIKKLQAGEAFIGDWKDAGLHSEMAYRCAKKVLKDCGLAAFRGTNKGTVASLVSTAIFSITAPPNNGPENGPRNTLAADQQRTDNEPTTTNHNDTRDTSSTSTPISEGETTSPAFPSFEDEEPSPDLPGIVEAYPRRQDVAQALDHLRASIRKGADPNVILCGTRAIAAVIQQLPSGALNGYVPSAGTFFKNERWKDDPATWVRNAGSKNGAALKPLDLGGRKAGAVIR